MKKALIFLILLCMVVATFTFAACGDKGDPSEGVKNIPELADWMSMIKDDTLVTDLVIPGSHDSGTRDMIVMAKTQSEGFAGQLEKGTRYFDVRVAEKKGSLVFFHGAVKGTLTYDEYLSDIKAFLDAHPTEFLILDYQHYDVPDPQVLFDKLEQSIGRERLLDAAGKTPREFIETLTLGQARGKCIVTLGAENGTVDKPYVFVRDADNSLREESILHSPYVGEYNKKDSETYIKEYIDKYIDTYTGYGYGICVLQGQLTGSLLTDISAMEEEHNGNMNAYVDALASDSEKLAKINVIMRDFITADKTSRIVALNKTKGFVKEECAADFEVFMPANQNA